MEVEEGSAKLETERSLVCPFDESENWDVVLIVRIYTYKNIGRGVEMTYQ